jgi:hypothetical protein
LRRQSVFFLNLKNLDLIIVPTKLDESRAVADLPPYEEYVKDWREQVT